MSKYLYDDDIYDELSKDIIMPQIEHTQMKLF